MPRGAKGISASTTRLVIHDLRVYTATCNGHKASLAATSFQKRFGCSIGELVAAAKENLTLLAPFSGPILDSL
jgi:hypothetical protein